MDWFENITGFREAGYAATRARLAIEGETLVSLLNGSRAGIGRLELCTLQALRSRAAGGDTARTRTTVRCLAGDARGMHAAPAFAGALFQVASQFNLLEMVSPEVSPEDGVTRYAGDRTQGPACAMAAGAGTIYRNYFAPVAGGAGQTATRQIDALAPLGEALAGLLGRPLQTLWTMRNGYALCTQDGLSAIARLLHGASETTLQALRGRLAIGLHTQVEVTDVPGPRRPTVSQAYCSALPVAYTGIAPPVWEPFARLVLEAAYEATLRAAVEQHRRGGSNTVLLTRLGGGAFGNEAAWIEDAMTRALRAVENAGLDVCLVSYGQVDPAMARIARGWALGSPLEQHEPVKPLKPQRPRQDAG